MSTGMMLEPTTSLHDALEALSAGLVEHAQLVEWLNATPIDMSQAHVLHDVLTIPELFELAGKQVQLAAIRARRAGGAVGGGLRVSLSKRGAISMYGVNTRFPITMYHQQWLRVIEFIKEGKLDEFLATKPVGTFSLEKDYTTDAEKKFIDSNPSNITIRGDAVTVVVAEKALN